MLKQVRSKRLKHPQGQKIMQKVVKGVIQFCNQNNVEFSLRGGGAICKSNKVHDPQSSRSNIEVSEGFDSFFKKFSQIIIDQIPIQSTESETLIAFQWFLLNEGQFWIISDNKKLVSSFYPLFLKTLEEFVTILPNYIRCSGYLFYQLLKICNFLMYVIVKYQFFNEQRYVEEEKKQLIKIQIGEIENLAKIEMSTMWETGVLFELQLLKTALTHLRTNSTQGRDIFIQFISGLATSMASFSLSDELKDALKEGAKLLFIKIYEEQIQNPIEIYKIFQFFKGLKWKILFQLGKKSQVYYMLAQLKDGYNQNLKNSKNWIVHYCWVEMISDLLAYRPIIHSYSLTKNEWNQLQIDKHIQPLPHNKNEACVNIFVQRETLNQKFSILSNDIDYFEFILFKQLLLQDSSNETNEIQLWNQYLTFEFQNQKQNQNEQQLDDLSNLIQLNSSFIEKLIQQCKQCKINCLSLCQQKSKLLEWYEKSQIQNSKRILLHDLDLAYQELEEKLQSHLMSVNELFHYFLFYGEKIKIFLKIKEINEINIDSIQIESKLNQQNLLQQNLLEQLATNWQNFLTLIINEQLNFVVLDNFKITNSFNEKSEIIGNYFDQPIQVIENMFQEFLKINEQCNNIFAQFTHKFQMKNRYEISCILNSLQKIQTVPILQNIINLIKVNQFQPSNNDDKNSASFNCQYDNLSELQITYIRCSQLSQSLGILSLFLHIQNTKQQFLKQYLQNQIDDVDNLNLNYLNCEQYYQEMNGILQEQRKYFQQLLNLPNSKEACEICQKVKQFESQLKLIKNTTNQKEFSEIFKNKILIYYRTISLKLNLLILFYEDWKEQRACLLKEYDNFLDDIDLEYRSQNPMKQNQSQLVLILDQLMSRLFSQLQT